MASPETDERQIDLMSESVADQFYEPTQDERTFACVSHLTIFVSSIGLLVAIGLWIYLRNRHPYAAFQAAQAVLFQFVVMILTFFVIAVILAATLGVFGVTLAIGGVESDAAFGVLAILAALVFVAVLSVLTLAMYAYAIYAAVRSYQMRRFQIPGIASIANAISPMPNVRDGVR